MIFLAMFASGSHYCMVFEAAHATATVEYTVLLNITLLGLMLSSIKFMDLWLIVTQYLSKSHAIQPSDEK